MVTQTRRPIWNLSSQRSPRLPNPDLGRDDDKWKLVLTATWRASPNDEGLAAFDTWDKRSKKYNADATREKWAELSRSPPAGGKVRTLFDLADQASPIWREVTPQQREEDPTFRELASTPLRSETPRAGQEAGYQDCDAGCYTRLINPNARGVAADAGQGSLLNIPETTPYYLPVDGAKLVSDLISLIRRYIILSDEQALAVALWAIHSFLFDIAEHTARLRIYSPAKRCGKTTLLKLLGALVRKAVNTDNSRRSIPLDRKSAAVVAD